VTSPLDLRAAAIAARSLTVSVDPDDTAGAASARTFALVIPTAHELELLTLEMGSTLTAGVSTQVLRATVERALVGWSGLIESDLPGVDSDAPLAFEPANVRTLLDERRDLYLRLRDVVIEQMERRSAALAAARKNSRPASPGTAPDPADQTTRATER